jgi:hypothetical protein
VNPSASGWSLTVSNTHGAVLHRWGQAPVWIEKNASVQEYWPRIGVRVIGSDRSLEHWVLLECDQYSLPVVQPVQKLRHPLGATDLGSLPKPLTEGQLAAVHALFREYLTWPPRSSPTPAPVSSVAHRLGVSATAISERLTKVQERAYALGMHKLTGVSDPDYVYLLIRHGYIALPDGLNRSGPGVSVAGDQ